MSPGRALRRGRRRAIRGLWWVAVLLAMGLLLAAWLLHEALRE
jgi:hypothetical protein